MSAPLLLGIDEGTTAVKAALFDTDLRPVAEARRPVPVTQPHPGWVEQDPQLILDAVVDAIAEVLVHADGREVVAAGLDHQGESVLAWDASDGRALTPLLVWQDKRQQSLLSDLGERGEEAVTRSGLPLDPYFSAGKLAWLLANDDAVAAARERGKLRLGTVDAFLTTQLGGRFATDLSTASRTQLLARGGSDWDPTLLELFGIERAWLPALGPSFGSLGELRHARWPAPLTLAAQLVDQQAALAGAGCVRPGQVKATYGTGVFVLGPTDGPVSSAGLLPTVAWSGPDGRITHALDGGVFAAGSLLDWLSQELGLAADAPALAATAASVSNSEGVMVLPALAGLGAPWWRPEAHGVIAGLHPGVGVAHVARAALEAIAWRVADIVEAMDDAGPLEMLRVGGGLTNDATLVQIQADALGRPVAVNRADVTVLGAAMLAGVGAGVFASVQEAAERLPRPRVVQPGADDGGRVEHRERWRRFVESASRL